MDALAKTYGEEVVEQILVYSSSHTLDTARHILGPLQPIKIYETKHAANARDFRSLSGLLETGQGTPVLLTVLADNPAPVGIRIFFDDQTTWHLSPMERLVACRGYDRTEPAPETNIGRSTSKSFLVINEDANFKPGFLTKMQAFINGQKQDISATPQEFLEPLLMIEEISSPGGSHA